MKGKFQKFGNSTSTDFVKRKSQAENNYSSLEVEKKPFMKTNMFKQKNFMMSKVASNSSI